MINPQQEPHPKQAKIGELESIRGLAALLVVFFHLPKFNSLLDVEIINNGYLMVELFFVLSGFVMYNAYANKIRDKKDLLRFQFLRFGRLYPVHIVFLLAFVLIEFLKYFSQKNLGIEIKSPPFEKNNIEAFFQQILLIQAIGPTGNARTFNYPAWSISVEFYTYLVFGVSILIAEKWKNILFVLIALASIFLLLTQTTDGFSDLLRCLAGFFIGCVTAPVIAKLKENTSNYISLLVFLCIIVFLQMKVIYQYDILIYFFTAALIASLVTSKNGYLNRVLKLKVLTWLGGISYTVYMSHAFVIWIFERIIGRVLNKPTILSPEGMLVPQLTTIETIFTCLLIVFSVLALSSLVYNFIEKPMRERSRRFAFRALS